MIVSHSKPSIDREDVDMVTKALSSGQISSGEIVKRFEDRIARFVGVKHGITASSGTSAIHLALVGLGVGLGDEVIIPSYVCTSPYMAVRHAGATPIVADVGARDFNLCADSVKMRTSPRTKAIILPHMFGAPAELDEILELGIPVVEDCAQSLGAEYKKRRVGSFGAASVCSFYATKMITTGEGGVVMTNDDEIYNKIADLRQYDKKPLNVVRYNYKMSDLQAALGLAQLKKLNSFVRRRRKIASIYDERFSRCPLDLFRERPLTKCAYYRYVVFTDELDRVKKKSRKRGVICEKPVFKPLHLILHSDECPNCDSIYDRALSIPIYPSLTDDEIDYVADTIEDATKR